MAHDLVTFFPIAVRINAVCMNEAWDPCGMVDRGARRAVEANGKTTG
jgi:hypothetical protein